ncbi:unnamed protein product, partial [Symbiodinium necroappetens]
MGGAGSLAASLLAESPTIQAQQQRANTQPQPANLASQPSGGQQRQSEQDPSAPRQADHSIPSAPADSQPEGNAASWSDDTWVQAAEPAAAAATAKQQSATADTLKQTEPAAKEENTTTKQQQMADQPHTATTQGDGEAKAAEEPSFAGELPPPIFFSTATGSSQEYRPLTHGCWELRIEGATNPATTTATVRVGQSGPLESAPPFPSGMIGRVAPMPQPGQWLLIVTYVPDLDTCEPHSLLVAEGDQFMAHQTDRGWRLSVEKLVPSTAREQRQDPGAAAQPSQSGNNPPEAATTAATPQGGDDEENSEEAEDDDDRDGRPPRLPLSEQAEAQMTQLGDGKWQIEIVRDKGSGRPTTPSGLPKTVIEGDGGPVSRAPALPIGTVGTFEILTQEMWLLDISEAPDHKSYEADTMLLTPLDLSCVSASGDATCSQQSEERMQKAATKQQGKLTPQQQKPQSEREPVIIPYAMVAPHVEALICWFGTLEQGDVEVHIQLPPILTPLREILCDILEGRPGGPEMWAKLVAVAEALEALLMGNTLAHPADVVMLSEGGTNSTLLREEVTPEWYRAVETLRGMLRDVKKWPPRVLPTVQEAAMNLVRGIAAQTPEETMAGYEILVRMARVPGLTWRQGGMLAFAEFGGRSRKVVDCAASVPDKQKTDRIGSAEDRAPIRVVMDLPSMSELPRSYPPPLIGREKPRSVPGLPSGYSVPLEAFTIEDGQLLLERQRVFNEGHIDPRYQWLQDIISSYRQSKDEEDDSGGANATSVVPQPKQKATSVRGFMSWLSGAVGVPEQTQALPPLTSYAGSEQPPAGRNSAGQAIAHEGLVSPYNSRKVASGPFRPREAEEKLNHIEVQSAAEGNPLDAQLQELLSRTSVVACPHLIELEAMQDSYDVNLSAV